MTTTALRDRSAATRPAIARAVARGDLMRPAVGWVSLPDADPMLTAAASIGVVVSCVTRAARLGCWDAGSRDIHVAARPGRALKRATTAHVHWAKPVIPRAPGILEDSIENALALVAECRPFEEALAVWESAIRQGLVTLEHLRTLPLRPAALRLVAAVAPFSDSGLESIVVSRLGWLGIPMQQQAWILGHRVDILIGERLIVQIDGGHHVDAQRLKDNAHDARLRLAGYHVIRVGYHQVMHDWPAVQALITGAIARGLHLAA